MHGSCRLGEIDTDTGDQYLQVIAEVGSSAVFMGLGSIYGDAKYSHNTTDIIQRPDGSSLDRLFSSHT
jgi:hypothetical protein